MSKSKIDLVNSALVLIGDGPITSLDDQTTQALVANTVLDDFIESELFETRWRFATETSSASYVSSITHATGLGVFQIPSGTIRVWNVLSSGRSIGGAWEMEGDKLLIDADENSVISIERVVEPPVGSWPPHFKLALIHLLASAFALGLTENESKAGMLMNAYQRYARRARSLDGGQSAPRAINTGQIIRTRFGDSIGRVQVGP
jgi:hypothetical protein